MKEHIVIKKISSFCDLRCEIYIGTEPTTDKKLKVILQKDEVLWHKVMLLRTAAMPLKPWRGS